MAIGDKIPVEAIRKALAENPVLKWAVVGVVAILAVEFLAKEAMSIGREIATWNDVTTATIEDARAKAYQACGARSSADTVHENCKKYALRPETRARQAETGAAAPLSAKEEKEAKAVDLARQEWEVLLLGLGGAVAWVIMARNIDARADEDRTKGAWRRLKGAGAALVISQGVPAGGARLLQDVPLHLPDLLFWLSLLVMVAAMMFLAVQILVSLWQLATASRAAVPALNVDSHDEKAG